jgi:hypothetical protein
MAIAALRSDSRQCQFQAGSGQSPSAALGQLGGIHPIAEQSTNVLMGFSGIWGDVTSYSDTRMIDLLCGIVGLDEAGSNHKATLALR